METEVNARTIEAEITRLELQPGERIFVSVKGAVTKRALEVVNDAIERLLMGTGVRHVVVGFHEGNEITFQVISPPEAPVVASEVGGDTSDSLGVE